MIYILIISVVITLQYPLYVQVETGSTGVQVFILVSVITTILDSYVVEHVHKDTQADQVIKQFNISSEQKLQEVYYYMGHATKNYVFMPHRFKRLYCII